MEVQFQPALQTKLDQIARESGRPAADVVHDAVAGYFDELSEHASCSIRATTTSRAAK